MWLSHFNILIMLSACVKNSSNVAHSTREYF